MIREDYLLRLIQQLGEFFRRTIGQQVTGSTAELDQKLEQLAGEILGLPTSLIMTLPPEDLMSLFEMTDRMVVEKCYVTAEINRLKSEVEEDPAMKAQFQERAVFFFSTIAPQLTGELSDRAKAHLKVLIDDSANS